MMRTRTSVHSETAARYERRFSRQSAFHALAGVQLGAQVILWITFLGYDRAAQATWQAALMLVIPLLAIWLVWRGGAPALDTKAGRWISLALLPCLALDFAFVLFALSGMIGQIMPQYPGWIGVAIPCALVFLTALSARPRGVSYGAYLLRWALILLFLLGTVFLRASTRGDRLWPLLGKGFPHTALAALAGAGSVWGAALAAVLPGKPRPRGKSVLWLMFPWAFGCIWALWYGFMQPWAQGDVLAVAEKMMGLARHAHSVMLYEVAGLMWLILLPLSLAGCLTSAEIITLAAFPRCPRPVPLLGLLLLPTVCLLAWPGQIMGAMETALPYRAALSLAAGTALLIAARKRVRR